MNEFAERGTRRGFTLITIPDFRASPTVPVTICQIKRIPTPGDVEPPERSEFCWMLVPDVNRGRLRYSGIASTKGFQRGQHLRGLLQLMALRITGVLPPILPAKTHTGASRRSWQFVLFQQDFIVILQRRGPLFFHAAR